MPADGLDPAILATSGCPLALRTYRATRSSPCHSVSLVPSEADAFRVRHDGVLSSQGMAKLKLQSHQYG